MCLTVASVLAFAVFTIEIARGYGIMYKVVNTAVRCAARVCRALLACADSVLLSMRSILITSYLLMIGLWDFPPGVLKSP